MNVENILDELIGLERFDISTTIEGDRWPVTDRELTDDGEWIKSGDVDKLINKIRTAVQLPTEDGQCCNRPDQPDGEGERLTHGDPMNPVSVKPTRQRPAITRSPEGIWMENDKLFYSVARGLAERAMLSLGYDAHDFRTRDCIINAISRRLNEVLDEVASESQRSENQ